MKYTETYLHDANDGPIIIWEILDTDENISGVKEGSVMSSKDHWMKK